MSDGLLQCLFLSNLYESTVIYILVGIVFAIGVCALHTHKRIESGTFWLARFNTSICLYDFAAFIEFVLRTWSDRLY